ncbi:MAG: HD domain-containing protein [Promethearchaeota archaeon]
MDSKEMQRLTRIRQLSGANHVFPGANHTRFEHSLGVAALANRLAANLKKIHDVPLSQHDINSCVIAGLLHDVGHGPFSHNFESILLKYLNKDHEDMGEWIIKKSQVGDILTDLGYDKNNIAQIATGRIIGKDKDTASLLSQVITGAVNVDTMDYLLRDNYHCGTQGRSVDINRLLLSIDVIDNIFLGVDTHALIALEGFLLSRVSSFRTIYFHKTCRAVQLMLGYGMDQVMQDTGILNWKSIDEYTEWDDFMLWAEMVKNPKSKPIIEKIRRRELLKICYESQIKIDTDYRLNRNEIKQDLASKANIPVSVIFIDLPSSSNVPYSHISSMHSNEIFTFNRSEGIKKRVDVREYSQFFNFFSGKLKILRIYTWPEYRKQLNKACNEYFKDLDSFKQNLGVYPHF